MFHILDYFVKICKADTLHIDWGRLLNQIQYFAMHSMHLLFFNSLLQFPIKISGYSLVPQVLLSTIPKWLMISI
ncbi:MAG: hypothetical protein EBQ58_15165 [Betaproteobacteria bacterium]|nr:hypothetical protein [Betaproteobacteria bacterium]